MFWSLRSPLNAQHPFQQAAAKMPLTDHTIAEHQMIVGNYLVNIVEHYEAED